MSYKKERRTSCWDDLSFTATAIQPLGAVSDPALDSTEAGFPGTLLFSGAADNLMAGVAQMPHAWIEESAIYPHIHVARTTNSANAMTWEFYYRRSNPAATGAFEVWSGPVAGTPEPAISNTANIPFMYAFGPVAMTGFKISTLINWRVYRRGSTDAYADACRMVSIDFHHQRDTLGSGSPYFKRA